MAPVTFHLKSLTISVNADSVLLDSFSPDVPTAGIVVNAQISLATVNKSFAFLVPNTTTFVNLKSNLSDVRFAVLPIPKTSGSTTILDWSSFLPSPSSFTMDFTNPETSIYQRTKFISPTATSNNSLADEILQYLSTSITHSVAEMTAALASSDGQFGTSGTYLTSPVSGLINKQLVISNLNTSISTNFAAALKSKSAFTISTGSTAPTTQGSIYPASPLAGEPYDPAIFIVKQLSNDANEESRLTVTPSQITLSSDISAQMPTGWAAYSLPLQAGDILQFNLTVVPATGTQSTDSVAVSSRSYIVRLAISA